MKIEAPRYVDDPQLAEIFVDRLRFMTFDGHQLRMEFDVIRKDPATGDAGRQWAYTACRLVLSAHGVPDLLDQVRRLSKALQPGRPQPVVSEGQRPRLPN